MADRELEQIVQEAFWQSAGSLLDRAQLPNALPNADLVGDTQSTNGTELVEAVLRNRPASPQPFAAIHQVADIAKPGIADVVEASFAEAAPGSDAELRERLAEATRQILGLTQVSQTLTDTVWANTQALLRPSASGQTAAGGTGRSVGNAALSLLTSGFGLSPLVTSLARLFSSSREEAPAPLVRYAAPPPIRFDAANSSWGANSPFGFAGVDYGVGSQPRLVQLQTEARATQAAATNSPQITIQVQAMDSRSFLDHSDDIARAVREAMLNMHPLNDVINDL